MHVSLSALGCIVHVSANILQKIALLDRLERETDPNYIGINRKNKLPPEIVELA